MLFNYTVKVFIDGVEHKATNDVKVVVEDLGRDMDAQVHVAFTSEGRVEDWIRDGEVFFTSNDTYEEMAENAGIS